MAQRKDGRQTQARLLDAACEVFSEKGFRDTKVADICSRAGTNVAAVNYYFGDKSTLYFEAWQEAYKRDVASDPVDTAEGSAEKRFRDRIRALVRRFCDPGEKGQFTRMYLMELTDPVALNHEKWRKLFDPRHRHLLKLIQDVAGPNATEEDVRFCEISVVNLCRGLLIINQSDLEYMVGAPVTERLLDRLADHITHFSLAGMRAVGERKERGKQ
ncbi:MAG: CerR family C-terminal domain-containing protein [Deltaproteobacteria bacterium]|nr:CerR family C-terminal domain-containing protein [Deltaproteobacteria bacterium]